MKTKRYQFERTIETTKESTREYLRKEYKEIFESNKNFTRKADYIGLSLMSIDQKLEGIEEEIKELQELRKSMNEAKKIALEVGAEIMAEYGINKIEGMKISSLTITKPKESFKQKITITNSDALMKLGYKHEVLDEQAVHEAINGADERRRIEDFVSVDITTLSIKSKIKINQKRRVS
jgi:hypothetical protein